MANCQCSCDNSWVIWLILPIMTLSIILVSQNNDPLSEEEKQIKEKEWKETQLKIGNFIDGYGILLGTGFMALTAFTSWIMRNKSMAVCCGILSVIGFLYMNGYVDLSQLQLGNIGLVNQPTDHFYGHLSGVIDGATD